MVKNLKLCGLKCLHCTFTKHVEDSLLTSIVVLWSFNIHLCLFDLGFRSIFHPHISILKKLVI